MQAWLMRLSSAFVLGALGFGGYLFFQGEDGERFAQEAARLRPAIDDLVGQGQDALRTLIETAQASEQPASPADARAKVRHAQLPFVVVEPRDQSAPMVLGSQRTYRDVAPAVPPMRLGDGYAENGPLDLEPVEARLRAKIPGELFKYFDLYLYVSKAVKGKGEWSQQLFVLARQPDQNFRLLHRWPVSTGLEEPLRAPSGKMLGTHTPAGIFKLDRDRFHADYRSRQWDAPMPFAMFFDWMRDGRISGLALHGTDEEGVKTLGERASHGCIRLSPEAAKTLFELIQANYRGKVPAFEINDQGTMSTVGALKRDGDGRVVMTRGYKVLVFIEDYGGPSQDMVAALF